MNIEYIREFVVLADTRNFNETAERLFTTQSTVSKHLKQVEAELGTPLFTRTSRSVKLNEAGEIFLPYARRLLDIQYEYTTALNNHLGNRSSSLTIGSLPVMAQYQITDVIARFNRENKNISLHVLEAEACELIPLLEEGTCELAFTRESPGLNDGFIRIPYSTDRLIALMPSSHPLAVSRKAPLSLEQLRHEPLLLIKEKTFLYELCIHACEQAGFTPNVVFSSHRIENIVDLVRKKMGVALLMEKQIMSFNLPEDVFTAAAITPDVTSRISLIYRKDRKLSAAGLHFLRCVEGENEERSSCPR